MSINKKWGAAAAGLLTIALVGSGAATANAAPGDPIKNPQSNGSEGSFYIFDENAELAEAPGKVFDRAQFVMAASDHVDFLSEIDPDDYAAAGSWDTVYKFIAKPNELNGGTGSWRAYALDSAAGPNGGVLTPNLTLGDLGNGNNGGIDSVFAADGDWLVGLAFTTNAGVTPVGMVYRTVTIDGDTDTYTYAPIEYDEVVVWAPDFAGYTANASATLRNGNIEIDADAAHAGKTVDVYAEGTAAPVHTGIVLDASGDAIVTSSIAAGTRLAIADTAAETVLAWATAEAFVLAEPVEGDANEVTIPAPAEGETVVVVPAGAENANQTFTPYVWSDPTVLAPVTTDASGNASVDLAGLPVGQHTVALVNSSDEIVAWGTVTLSSTTTSATDLTVDVTTSNRFELSGVNTSVNLGTVRRGATTAPAALGAFTVIDDRDLLPGWTLNAEVADFVNAAAGNDVIEKSALGLAPKQVGTAVEGVSLGTAQAAGAGTYSALFAEGAANSSTLEVGTQFDADLTFAAPAKAKKGTYASTLTLTLASK